MRGRKAMIQVVDLGGTSVDVRSPKWLSTDAKAEWRRVVPILTRRGILTDGDLATLANYCAAIGTVIQAQKILSKDGLIYTGNTGPKRHPATGILNDAMTQSRQLAAELGLTPVSRARPALRDNSDHDDAFMDL